MSDLNSWSSSNIRRGLTSTGCSLMPPVISSAPSIQGGRYRSSSASGGYVRGSYSTPLYLNDLIARPRESNKFSSGMDNTHRRNLEETNFDEEKTSTKERQLDMEYFHLMAATENRNKDNERHRQASQNEAERIRMIELSREVELEREKRQEAAQVRLLNKERELEEWKLERKKVEEKERLYRVEEEERQREIAHQRELVRIKEMAAAAQHSPSSSSGEKEIVERLTRDLREREDRNAAEARRRDQDNAARLQELTHKHTSEMMDLRREIERERVATEDTQRLLTITQEKLDKLSKDVENSAGVSRSLISFDEGTSGIGSSSSQIAMLKQSFEEEKSNIDRRHRNELEQLKDETTRQKIKIEDEARIEIRRRNDTIHDLERTLKISEEKARTAESKLEELERKYQSILRTTSSGESGSSPNRFSATTDDPVIRKLRDEIKNTNNELEDLKNSKRVLTSQLDEAVQRVEVVTRQNATYMNEIRDKDDALYNGTRKLREEKDDLEREITRLKHSFEDEKVALERAKQIAIDHIRKEAASGTDASIKRLTDRIEEERRRSELEKKELMEKADAAHRQLTQQHEIFNREKQQLETKERKTIENGETALKACKDELLHTNTKLENTIKDMKEQEIQYGDLESSFNRLEEAFKKLKKEHLVAETESRDSLEKKTIEINDLQRKLANTLAQADASMSAAGTLNSDIQAILAKKDDTIKSLTDQFFMIKKENLRVVDELNELKRKLEAGMVKQCSLEKSLKEANEELMKAKLLPTLPQPNPAPVQTGVVPTLESLSPVVEYSTTLSPAVKSPQEVIYTSQTSSTAAVPPPTQVPTSDLSLTAPDLSKIPPPPAPVTTTDLSSMPPTPTLTHVVTSTPTPAAPDLSLIPPSASGVTSSQPIQTLSGSPSFYNPLLPPQQHHIPSTHDQPIASESSTIPPPAALAALSQSSQEVTYTSQTSSTAAVPPPTQVATSDLSLTAPDLSKIPPPPAPVTTTDLSGMPPTPTLTHVVTSTPTPAAPDLSLIPPSAAIPSAGITSSQPSPTPATSTSVSTPVPVTNVSPLSIADLGVPPPPVPGRQLYYYINPTTGKPVMVYGPPGQNVPGIFPVNPQQQPTTGAGESVAPNSLFSNQTVTSQEQQRITIVDEEVKDVSMEKKKKHKKEKSKKEKKDRH